MPASWKLSKHQTIQFNMVPFLIFTWMLSLVQGQGTSPGKLHSMKSKSIVWSLRWMWVQIFAKGEACKAEHANSACHWSGLPRILLWDRCWIRTTEGKDHQGRPKKEYMNSPLWTKGIWSNQCHRRGWLDGLSEKVPSCFQHFSEQDAKDARNQTTVTGSTTRARGVAFFSVVGTPGGRQPIPSLDPSESFPLLTKMLMSLGLAPGLRKVQMGRPCSMVMEVETKVPTFHLICTVQAALSKFCNTQAAVYNPWHRSWQLSSLHTGSTSSHSTVFDFKKSLDFWYSVNLLN